MSSDIAARSNRGAWRRVALKDLVDERGVTYGVVQPGRPQQDGVPIVRVNNLTPDGLHMEDVMRIDPQIAQRYARSRLRGGEVLITLVGSVGNVAVVPAELAGCNVARAVGVVPIRSEISARWVAWCLETAEAKRYLESRLNTTVQKTLNLRDLAALEVPIPPAREVEAISSVLGPIDDKIASNRRLSETLERVVRALIEHALFRPEAVAWPETTLGEVLSVLETGNRPRGGVKGISEGVPSIGAESITRAGIFDFAKLKFVPRDYYDQLRRGRLQDRDVLLYKDGGKPGDFRPHVSMIGEGFPFDEAAINEHVYRLRVGEPYSQDFLYAWLRTDRLTDEMRRRGTGVAIPGLNSGAVRDLPMIQPDRSALGELQETIAPLMSGVLRYAMEARVLAEIRVALLPALVSGRLRVDDKASADGPPLPVELVAS